MKKGNFKKLNKHKQDNLGQMSIGRIMILGRTTIENWPRISGFSWWVRILS